MTDEHKDPLLHEFASKGYSAKQRTLEEITDIPIPIERTQISEPIIVNIGKLSNLADYYLKSMTYKAACNNAPREATHFMRGSFYYGEKLEELEDIGYTRDIIVKSVFVPIVYYK